MLAVLSHLPNAIEKMDDESRPISEFVSVERALDRINTTSGSFYRTAMWLRTEYEKHDPSLDQFSFLDVGCGGGGLLRYLARYAKKYSLKVSFFGIDTNSRLLEIARAGNGNEFAIDYSSDRLELVSGSFSLVHSNLVLHHIPALEIDSFLDLTKRKSKYAVRHEDLIRSRLGLFLASWFPKLITQCSIVHYDAKISVHRAYSLEEWKFKSQAIGYSSKRIFPERMQLEWRS